MKLLFIAEPFIWIAVQLYRRFKWKAGFKFAGALLKLLVKIECWISQL